MTNKTSPSPDGLRAMLAEAVQAYELTKAAYLRDRFLGEAEQARAGDLLAALAATEQAAQDLLAKAGLAHIAGAPLQPGETAAPARRADEAVAAAFAAAQTAYVELRAALCRLAEVQLSGQKWEDARRSLKPLLADRSAPLGAYAHELLCESYYRPGKQALEAGKSEVALLQFLALMEQGPGYHDSIELLKRAYQSLPKQMHPKISGLEFVKIPAGGFLYGEGKQKVHLDEFWIARTPVTNAQYQVFVKATGYQAPSHWSNGQPPKGKEQHPVVNVSWGDAQKFCGWAGVSLPGEHQWEKAARGSDGRTYPWGEAAPDSRRCNFNNQVGDTTPVGSYPDGASPYGLLDMAGNVWEWCEDAHESVGRVWRSGGFNGAEGNVRCAYRYGANPDSRNHLLGFRVVAPSF